jgi:glucan biosynthesis protein
MSTRWHRDLVPAPALSFDGAARLSAPGSEGLSPDTGFAGFRPWYPVLQDGVYEEFVAYLGASYFRAQGLGEPHKVVRRRFREGGR